MLTNWDEIAATFRASAQKYNDSALNHIAIADICDLLSREGEFAGKHHDQRILVARSERALADGPRLTVTAIIGGRIEITHFDARSGDKRLAQVEASRAVDAFRRALRKIA